ncbi:MAG: DUF2953 domain-containing protein [Eubacterium sp.]|nr:DUF2953 domain-containing protein [Eubacterium sp.]
MAALLHILLIIGKILLVLLLIILAILFILLICPFFWKIHLVKEGETLTVKAGLSSTARLIFLNLDYDKGRQDNEFSFDLLVFGLPILKMLKSRKEKKEKAKKEAEQKRKEEIKKHIREGTIPANPKKRKRKRKSPTSVPASKRKKRKKKKMQEENDGAFIGTDAGKISYRIREIFRKLKNGFDKIGDWKAYLESPSFGRVKAALSRELPAVMRSILPKRIKGYLVFGFEDPAMTGMAAGAMAMLLGLTDRLQISPDFQEQKFEADIMLKGRFLLLMLIIHAVKLILNKDVKALIRRF